MTPVQFQRCIVQGAAISTATNTANSAGFHLALFRDGAVIAGGGVAMLMLADDSLFVMLGRGINVLFAVLLPVTVMLLAIGSDAPDRVESELGRTGQ